MPMVNNMYKKMREADPTKPKRLGEPWDDLEVAELLSHVKNGKSHMEIARAHERTEGSITSRLKVIASTMHLDENKDVNECCKVTGLTKDQVIDAVNREEYKRQNKTETSKQRAARLEQKTKESLNSAPKYPTPESQETLVLLREIHSMLRELLDR
jgi:hypothetical protein